LELLLECALFVVGLVFGSFLNVCITRIPRDQSIVSPPSHCPYCRKPIRWRDNIPLLSWIVLRGLCRDCGQPISGRYPVVELLTASLFVACYASFGTTWLTLKFCVFCFLIVGLIFMDAETGLLPREFTYSGIGIGFATAWFNSIDASGTSFLLSVMGARSVSSNSELYLLDSVVGAGFGAAFFYLAWALYYLVRRRHGVGFGDIALIAMVGAFLGLKLTVLVVFLSPIMATVFAVTMLLLNRNKIHGSQLAQLNANGAESFFFREVPFGVFLGASSLIALFVGREIWGWYLGLFR
jgi:leader peptidase (prepilin peptidase) / N-methyltransferase